MMVRPHTRKDRGPQFCMVHRFNSLVHVVSTARRRVNYGDGVDGSRCRRDRGVGALSGSKSISGKYLLDPASTAPTPAPAGVGGGQADFPRRVVHGLWTGA